MKLLITLTALLIFFCSSLTGQNAAERSAKLNELNFLIGTWDLTFEWYDTHQPDSEVIFVEKGQQTCEYDFYQNGMPMFITCRGELKSDRGRTRTIQESIRYGKFVQTFERTGLYSNWPATGNEVLYFDPTSRNITIYGELDVQNNMLERYEDVYQFNEDYSYFDRKNIANFSDMPITEFNLTMKGTGRKIK